MRFIVTKSRLFSLFLCIFLIHLCISLVKALAPGEVDPRCKNVIVSEKNVYDYIFSNYSRDVTPKRNYSEPVDVNIRLVLSGIYDFIELQNTLILNGHLDIYWHDDYLKYENIYPHACVPSIRVPADLIWLADVGLTNSPEDPYSLVTTNGQLASVDKAGYVQIAPAGQLVVSCELDLYLFPFDIQTCKVRIESWMYNSNQQSLTFMNESILIHSWTENKNWELVNKWATKTSIPYGNIAFDMLQFYFVLKRKANFYIVNVIIPSMLIAVVELVTFLVPLAEAIKIHISFTSLLAYSVFQAMVIEDLPRSSDSPLLCVYIDAIQAFICAALIGQGIALHFTENAKNRQPIPSALYKIVRIFGKCICVQFDNEDESASNATTTTTPEEGRKASQSTGDESGSSTSYRGWLLMARVIDRLNVICYALAIFGTPIIMFAFIPLADREGGMTKVDD